jgi:hypothetical protein
MLKNVLYPWLENAPRRISEVLNDVIEWRHKCSLSGRFERYDSFLGCYGNPKSKIVLLSEIPDTHGLDKKIDEYHDTGKSNSDLWRWNWKISKGDMLLRRALVQNCLSNKEYLIPSRDPYDDKPATWNFWLTDFVKCPSTTRCWRAPSSSPLAIVPEIKENVIKASQKILQNEMNVIKPRAILVMGDRTRKLFQKLGESNPDTLTEVPIFHVRHYSLHHHSPAKEKEYLEEFRSIFQRLRTVAEL